MNRISARRLGRPSGVALVCAAAAFALFVACGGGDSEEPTPTVVAVPTATVTTEHKTAISELGDPTATPQLAGDAPTPTEFGTLPVLRPPDGAPGQGGRLSGPNGYFMFNQWLIEGLYNEGADLEDVDDVFWYIFSRLPDEVMVYPSENYYYFIMYVSGRQFWGNMRLPAGRRERGVLSFAYFEFIDYPSVPGTGSSRAKYFTEADGLRINMLDEFTYEVRYNQRSVIFNLHKLSQEPPALFSLGEDEVFVERTFDESGYQFFLLFNEKSNYFIWVLNEEEPFPDILEPIAEDVLVGRRSGFAFWVDKAHEDRKILATIRRIAVTRNDYYDGPFDQLADNYVDGIDISGYMERAYPGLKGRIDKYGYYTDTERSSRVALSNYGTYYTQADVLFFIEQAKASDDPYHYISRSGAPLSVQATPTPTSTSD